MDFKRIDKDGDDFELLCRDVLENLGVKIISRPSKGPDGKKDLLIKIDSEDLIGRNESTVYLVQCKHKAHGGRSVLESDLGDWRSACDYFEAKGYFLITSTIPAISVNNSLEAANEKGDYKTQIWDRKLLESKIEECPNSNQIIKRYSLIDNIDILGKYTRKIIDGYEYLPFKFKEEIDFKNAMVFVYEEIVEFEDEKFKIKQNITRYGFLCVVKNIEVNQIDEIKGKIDCEKIYVISDEPIESINSITLDQLNNDLGQFKDSWYQYKILQLAANLPSNPSGIRLLETVFKNLPYKLQPVAIEFFRHIFNRDIDENNHPIFLYEILQIIKKNELDFLTPDILNLLVKVHNSILNKLYKSFLSSHILNVLGHFDKKNSLLKKIEDGFDQSKSIQFKLDCLEYYSIRKSDHIKTKVLKLLEENQDEEVLAKNHGIYYKYSKSHLVENEVPWTVKRYVDDYLKVINI